MVKPTEYKQRETVKDNGTKEYKNTSKERLLRLTVLLKIYLEMGLIKSRKCKISH